MPMRIDGNGVEIGVGVEFRAMCRNAIELDEIEFAASCSGFGIRIRIRVSSTVCPI